jgi:hypothetical protein
VGTLRHSHQVNEEDELEDINRLGLSVKALMSFDENDQADRAISTSKLHASRRFHTWPINVVVYHGSQRSLVLRWVSRLDAFSGYPVHT